ncbi:MAG: hypothetical protein L3V56_13930, partial [Candidatus Magnetoovum sp. WYHC-5]|nr:hypothetical protein [Candidatus Magnetoovum sp. WYHC-5]
MKKIFIITMILIELFLLHEKSAYAWKEEYTHPAISESAVNNSTLKVCSNAQSDGSCNYLENYHGFKNVFKHEIAWFSKNNKQNILQWIKEGSTMEDAGSVFKFKLNLSDVRFRNHFHNPMKTWDVAGINDVEYGFRTTGNSLILWAQNVMAGSTGDDQNDFPEGDWSWDTTREFFLNALIASDKTSREENWAKTFRGIGHQLHLIQDSSVPA